MLSGTGDIIEPDDGVAAIGSGGPYALAAARALLKYSGLEAKEIVAEEGLRPAGVLAPLYMAGGEAHLLFTHPPPHPKDHQGQISFPGGVQDPGDPNLLATALRETEEEIGLKPEAVEVLGALSPVATVTGYWIIPFVGLIPHPYEFRLNPREVKHLLAFPVQEFFPAARWSTGLYTYKGHTVQVCCWKHQGTVIWGATARMLLDFLSRLGEHPLTHQCVD